MNPIEKSYRIAQERYAEIGVDTNAAMEKLKKIPLSLQCWQGDDLGGNEKRDRPLTGGILITGNHPGKARTMEELRKDFEKVFALLPGRHRLSLHMMYGDFGDGYVDRDRIEPKHFAVWVDWAQSIGIKLDMNATLFSHPKADSGFTLSHKDEAIRSFWIEHVIKAREVTAYMGRTLGSPAIHNLWIPDGSKEIPYDSRAPRLRLKDSLDTIFSHTLPEDEMKDAVEGKLFGIGSESYVVGSYDFYLSYAIANGKMLTVDNGHFHPTESVADKLSALLLFVKELLLHVTRGIRWDSDHVPILNDEIMGICQQLVRGDMLKKVNIALDFFDASINRIGAYVIGADSVLKALLYAVLEPARLLEEAEKSGDYYARLALQEQSKIMPFGAVWDYWCMQEGIPTGTKLMDEIRRYERDVLMQRT